MRLTLVIALLVLSRLAAAQPVGAQAEVLFREGVRLMAAGSIAEACDAFAASQKLEPDATTLLNEASCREKNGQLASAWGLYLAAERATRDATDPTNIKRHQVAVDHSIALEPRLSTLEITVADEARVGGLEILRNGEVVDAAIWGKVMPVDAGTYTITARAPGNMPWSTSVTVGRERDTKSVEIPRLRGADLKPAKPPVTEPVDSPVRRRSIAPYVVGGGAVLALGGGLALGIVSSSTYDRAKSDLDPDRQLSLWRRANNQRYVAEGFAIAGVAAAGIAVWLYVHDRRVAVVPERRGVALVATF